MDSKVDFFQKKLTNPRSFSRQKKMSKAWIWLLVCLLLLVFGFIAWRILCHNDVEIVDQDENVSLSL